MARANSVPPAADARHRAYKLEILLVSFAALLLEISYTRIISYKLFYYYTYLVIGLALLGIGAGGVLVAVSRRVRRAETESILLWSLLLGAASVFAGYVLIALMRTDTLSIWDYGTFDSISNVGRLIVICLALFGSFLSVGVIIATLFSRGANEIGRLYFADLIGAGLACAVVVSLLGWIGPPATMMLAGLILALVGLRLAARRRSFALVPAVALSVLLAAVVVGPELLPYERTDAIKGNLDDTGHIWDWSALFRVDALQFSPDSYLLFHDGLAGSAIYRYNGDPASLTRFDNDPRSFPFTAEGTPPKDVLIIGAAGGNEILASLHFDAGHIDAVELNPVTYSLVTDKLADFDGRLADNPKVNYVKGDGRTFLARSDDKYKLIWFPAPDSYSATNAATSGAFVLSESYLYTSEINKDSLDRLGPGGMIATQYGEFDYANRSNRTTRYVATARRALSEIDVHDPSRHILVVTTPTEPPSSLSTILVKKPPFTQAEIDRTLAALQAVPGATLRYAPGHPVESESVSKLATIPDSELGAFYDSYPYDVRPVTDDGPFFWHFTPFGDVIGNFTHSINDRDLEVAVGERALLLLLFISIAFAAVFLLLPFVTIRRTWSQLPRKPRSALYFSALGLGFMFFEITLIQRLTLFLGYPTYSLTVTLASLLIFTGVGALLSARYRNPHRALVPLLAAIVALTLFYQFALPRLTDGLLGWPFAGSVVLTFLVLAPLGICLGTFMPVGLGAISRLTTSSREYVAWGWAVNGFASVVGAVLSTILAMESGFRVVLLLGLVLYLVALVTLRGLLRLSSNGEPVPAQQLIPPEPAVVGASEGT
jgi:spermidine synthase/MFS family permease